MIESDLPPRDDLSEMEVISPRLLDRPPPKAAEPAVRPKAVLLALAGVVLVGILAVGAIAAGLLLALAL